MLPYNALDESVSGETLKPSIKFLVRAKNDNNVPHFPTAT
jgi:hypothetical protein